MSALAQRLAAYFHDDMFAPGDRAERAMALLAELAESGRCWL
jgi:hypothetical protein